MFMFETGDLSHSIGHPRYTIEAQAKTQLIRDTNYLETVFGPYDSNQ